MTEIPRAPVERILRQAGARRVSGGATAALAALAEEHCLAVAREAVKLAGNVGRRTVTAGDIRMAVDLITR